MNLFYIESQRERHEKLWRNIMQNKIVQLIPFVDGFSLNSKVLLCSILQNPHKVGFIKNS